MSVAKDVDTAMVAYLSGEDEVIRAGRRIWEITGALVEAQNALEDAADAFHDSLLQAGIASDVACRVGGALILRLAPSASHDARWPPS